MTIEIKRNANEIVFEIMGRLDSMTAPTLEKSISDNLDNIKSLILDFKGLEYISSAGLRVILSTQKKMQSIGTMKVINVCELIKEVFEMTGFAEIIDIE